MSKGYVDHFGDPSWPKFGTLHVMPPLATIVSPSARTSIFTVDGQGVIYGGWMRISQIGGNIKLVQVFTKIDGIDISTHSFDVMDWLNFQSNLEPPISLLQYDNTIAEGCVGMQREISHTSQVDISVYNPTASNVVVAGKLYYYLVE